MSRRHVALSAREDLVKGVVFLAPVVVILAMVYLRGLDMDIYLWIVGEAGPSEDLTVVWYALTALVAFVTGIRLVREREVLPGAAMLLLAVAAFFVGGEEVSWGQRWFNVEPGAFFLERNVQQETNVHNLDTVQPLLHGAYILVGVFGALAWMLPLRRGKHALARLATYAIPGWYLATWFLPVALLYGYWEFVPMSARPFTTVFQDQEIPELLLSGGFLLLALRAWLHAHDSKLTAGDMAEARLVHATGDVPQPIPSAGRV